jgi:hypothetical protein
MSLLLTLFFVSTLVSLPTGFLAFMGLLLATLPFIMDGAISVVNVTHSQLLNTDTRIRESEIIEEEF